LSVAASETCAVAIATEHNDSLLILSSQISITHTMRQ
jgi:hypothetical protein